MTDKYWVQAAIAPQGNFIEAEYDFKFINNADVYETSYTTASLTLTPGATVESIGYMMAGPKDYKMLRTYEQAGIGNLTNAIGWGKLKILVKPISRALSWLGNSLGSIGLGILALTLLIKLIMFPLQSKAYASQANMKKVQPKLKKLQERYKDDRMKLQQEMMALYKKEGANPAAGACPLFHKCLCSSPYIKPCSSTLTSATRVFLAMFKTYRRVIRFPLSMVLAFYLGMVSQNGCQPCSRLDRSRFSTAHP